MATIEQQLTRYYKKRGMKGPILRACVKHDLSNVGANVVSGKVNADTTLIAPGRIQVYSTATLEDWRYGNTTTIDGGAIAADTVTAGSLLVRGTNWLNNSGFETGSSAGWVAGSGNPTIGTWAPHSGLYQVGASGDGASNLSVLTQASLPVEEGRNYYMAVWVKNVSGAGQAGCFVSWWDAAGSYISTSTCYSAASTSWTKNKGVARAPTGARYGNFVLTIRSDNSSVVIFDDAEFYLADASVMVGTPASARVEINRVS